MIHTWTVPEDGTAGTTLCGKTVEQQLEEANVLGDECQDCISIWDLDTEMHRDFPTSWFESIFTP
jgi:hypothetical protein